METVEEKLTKLMNRYFCIGDSYAYNLTREKEAFAVGTVALDDFEEFEEETVADVAEYLIQNGVTVQDEIDTDASDKWVSVDEPPKKDGRYLVARFDYLTSKHFADILWFEKGIWWNRLHTGNWAVTHWMPLPEPPRGVR